MTGPLLEVRGLAKRFGGFYSRQPAKIDHQHDLAVFL